MKLPLCQFIDDNYKHLKDSYDHEKQAREILKGSFESEKNAREQEAEWCNYTQELLRHGNHTNADLVRLQAEHLADLRLMVDRLN